MSKKTLAGFLGLNKPAATVVVVNNAPGATGENAPETPKTGDAAPTTEEPTTEAPATPPTETAPTPEAAVPTTTAETAVSISQAELTQLRTDAAAYATMKPQYDILNTWYQNVKGEGVPITQDASTANAAEQKSWQKASWNNPK